MNKFVLIMAGGVGSRFWPASRRERPKQFMDFLGTGKSLLQLTYERFSKEFEDAHIYIVTNSNYKKLVQEQLPNLPQGNILGEPVGKNTSAAIAFGCFKIHELHGKSNVIVSPSDHLILDGDVFMKTIKTTLEFVNENKALVTIGIKPTRPDTGYGYIQYVDMPVTDDIYQVKTFVEKPNKEMAEELLKSGDFVWNAGIFAWNTESIIQEFKKYLPEISSLFGKLKGKWGTDKEENIIAEIYPQCKSISIDYGILEHSKMVYLSPGSFQWSDLGTWLSLFENAEKQDNNNAIIGSNIKAYNTEGSLLYNDDKKPLVTNGIKDLIVVKSDGIVLVCHNSKEQDVKQIVNDLKSKYKEKFT